MNTFFIADTHFYHHKMLSLRKFKNSDEMNNTIIQNWNMLVNTEDIVYHLGDVTFSNFEKTKLIFDKLKGKKILIKGNHDEGRSNTWFKNLGFSEVYDELILDNKFILTHRPFNLKHFNKENLINIHGHTHGLITNFNTRKYICVSVEMTNYFPLKLIK